MTSPEFLLLYAAAFCYLVAALLGFSTVGPRADLSPRAGAALLAAGAAFHLASFGLWSVTLGHLAVTTLTEALSFLALLVVLVFLLGTFRRPLPGLAGVVGMLALGFTLAAAIRFGRETIRPLPAILDSVWLPVHVTLAFLGDAIFALAFAVSLLYLLKDRRLKAHRDGGWLRRMPSLEALDRLNYTCLAWGLGLLTLGIVTGVVWAHEAWGRMFWASDPKLVFSLVTWAIYVVLLQGRMVAGWRGRRAATLTIAGFAVILVSLIGVNVLAIGLHGKAF